MQRTLARRAWSLATLAVLALAGRTAEAGLTFNFTAAPGTSQQAIDGFAAAGARWSSLFTDNMTVNINIAFTALGSGILGQASSSQALYAYSDVRSALIADKKSADDATATSHLQTGPGVDMLLNRTSNNPNGFGSATPYLDNDDDANNTAILMTNANAKALGLLAGNNGATDASISFSSSFAFDFDPSNGITAGAFDFIGIAAHEIGHALGFISGVDILDTNSPPLNGPFRDNQFTFVSTLDLYRYSTASASLGAIDWTADNRTKYFSIDGGATNTGGATFSTGVFFGDGNQASHWKDNRGIGIMDPTADFGELLAISANDIRAFDVIGYDLVPLSANPVPEPSTLFSAALAVLFGGAVIRGRRRRRSA